MATPKKTQQPKKTFLAKAAEAVGLKKEEKVTEVVETPEVSEEIKKMDTRKEFKREKGEALASFRERLNAKRAKAKSAEQPKVI